MHCTVAVQCVCVSVCACSRYGWSTGVVWPACCSWENSTWTLHTRQPCHCHCHCLSVCLSRVCLGCHCPLLVDCCSALFTSHKLNSAQLSSGDSGAVYLSLGCVQCILQFSSFPVTQATATLSFFALRGWHAAPMGKKSNILLLAKLRLHRCRYGVWVPKNWKCYPLSECKFPAGMHTLRSFYEIFSVCTSGLVCRLLNFAMICSTDFGVIWIWRWVLFSPNFRCNMITVTWHYSAWNVVSKQLSSLTVYWQSECTYWMIWHWYTELIRLVQ